MITCRRLLFLTVIWGTIARTFALAGVKPCVAADKARTQLNKDVCISAHVYEVVELADGTRFLDVCSPQTSDEACRFTIVSLPEDRSEVGELAKYRDMDVNVRGIVRSMHGRAGMLLSHARQFSGGPPRFRPNPMLTRGFSAEQGDPPIRDPNLHSSGGRSFMKNSLQEPRPVK